MNWFYESGGQQQGPISEQDLDRLLTEGKITLNTLVWREGLPDWQPLRIAIPSAGTASLRSDAGAIPSGHVRCTLTGKIIPESEAIYIQGKPYSAEAKPQVLHSLQTGGLLPTAEDLARNGPAWEQRQELGFFQAIWQTIKSVLLEPSATFGNMRREGGLGTPLTFYLLMSVVGYVVFFTLTIIAVSTGAIPRELLAGNQLQQLTAVRIFVDLITAPIRLSLWIFFYSAVVHVCLMICGGAKRPLETTFRTLCYAGGSGAALTLVPLCGWAALLVWPLVAQIIGLARTHETTTGRAALAVLLPIIICCGLLFLAAVLGFGALRGMSNAMNH
jgi:hypothetical protein